MAYRYASEEIEFIRRNHPIVNAIYADELLHKLGATSYIARARILGSVEPDHMHQGSRYWLTGDLIDAFERAA